MVDFMASGAGPAGYPDAAAAASGMPGSERDLMMMMMSSGIPPPPASSATAAEVNNSLNGWLPQHTTSSSLRAPSQRSNTSGISSRSGEPGTAVQTTDTLGDSMSGGGIPPLTVTTAAGTATAGCQDGFPLIYPSMMMVGSGAGSSSTNQTELLPSSPAMLHPPRDTAVVGDDAELVVDEEGVEEEEVDDDDQHQEQQQLRHTMTSEVSTSLAKLIEDEVLRYLIPTPTGLRLRRMQMELVSRVLSDAIRQVGMHQGRPDYGQIRLYIFGSVNMRTVLPDADNDVTLEIDGLIPLEASGGGAVASGGARFPSTPTTTPATTTTAAATAATTSSTAAAVSPSPLPSSNSFPASAAARSALLHTDSSSGNEEGTAQVATTAEGQPHLVPPVTIGVASGALLGGVRDFLLSSSGNSSHPPAVYVDSMVSAEVRVLKLIADDCNYDVTISQFGGVNCAQFFHEMDGLMGQQHLLKRTLLLLKAWFSYEAHILGGQGGYLSSYAVSVMLISLLNMVEFLEDVEDSDANDEVDGTVLEAERDEPHDGEGDATAATAPDEEEDEGEIEEVTVGSIVPPLMTGATQTGSFTPLSLHSGRAPLAGAPDDASQPQMSAQHGSYSHHHPHHQLPTPTATIATTASSGGGLSGRRPTRQSLSPLVLFARFLKFYAYFDFSRYCVTAFGPLELSKLVSGADLDLSQLEVPSARERGTTTPPPPADSIACEEEESQLHQTEKYATKQNRGGATGSRDDGMIDVSELGLTAEGKELLGPYIRRRAEPYLTVSGVKHLLHHMNVTRLEERQQFYDTHSSHASWHRDDTLPPHPPLNKVGNAAEDNGVGLLCPSCTTVLFPVRAMNVLDPLRWSSNMTRGVCRNHLQRIQLAFREGLLQLQRASCELQKGDNTATPRLRTGVSPATSRSLSIEATPCPGYPAPASNRSLREVQVIQSLFHQTVHTIKKYSRANFPWSQDGSSSSPLPPDAPRCAGCRTPSVFCTEGHISRMCEPQFCFSAPWQPREDEEQLRELGCLGEVMLPDPHRWGRDMMGGGVLLSPNLAAAGGMGGYMEDCGQSAEMYYYAMQQQQQLSDYPPPMSGGSNHSHSTPPPHIAAAGMDHSGFSQSPHQPQPQQQPSQQQQQQQQHSSNTPPAAPPGVRLDDPSLAQQGGGGYGPPHRAMRWTPQRYHSNRGGGAGDRRGRGSGASNNSRGSGGGEGAPYADFSGMPQQVPPPSP